jgi:hypothetical protein
LNGAVARFLRFRDFPKTPLTPRSSRFARERLLNGLFELAKFAAWPTLNFGKICGGIEAGVRTTALSG